MRAGALDRRITIERVTSTPDEFNAPVEKWITLATVWASKKDWKHSEMMRAGGTGSEIITRFQFRYSSTVGDVSPRDRINYGGTIYDIVAVREIGYHEAIEVTASARND